MAPDLHPLLRVAEMLGTELGTDPVIEEMLITAVRTVPAERAALVMNGPDATVRATDSADGEIIVESSRLSASGMVPEELIERILSLGDTIVIADASIADASGEAPWAGDPYIARRGVRSILAVPLRRHDGVVGALYLESSRAQAFSADDVEILKLLASQAGLALEDAELHAHLGEAQRLDEDRERCLQALFREVPGRIWATDRELRITYVAGSLPDSPWFEAEAWVGRTVYDVVGEHEPTEPAVAHHLRALAGKVREFEYHYRGRTYAVRIEPLTDTDQRIVGTVGTALDVTDRRATDERMARNEARLSEAQRVAHVGSFEWEAEPNVVTASSELLRIYGFEPETFDGSFETLLAAVHPGDAAAARRDILTALLDRKPFTLDHRVVRPDGDIRVVHTRGDIIEDAQGNPVRLIGTSFDVTELREAMQAGEHSVSLLQTTVDATADGILVVDRTGRVSLVNQRLQELWSLPADEPEGGDERDIVDRMLVQVEDTDGFLAGLLELRDRPELEYSDVVRLKDGRAFLRYSRPQRVGDTIVGRVWSYRDITEREHLLKGAVLLADASSLVASLDVEGALDAIAQLLVPDFGDGCLIDLFENEGPRRVFTACRDPRTPMPSETNPAVAAGQALLYRAGRVSRLGVPLSAKGEIVGAITLAASPHRKYRELDLQLAQDLGRRVGLAIQNARLYQRAQEALRARDEFLSIASHEIRGPITSMHLAAQMLRRGQLAPEAASKMLETIEREDRRLTKFVDELLDISRIQAGALRFDLEDVDLGETVRGVVRSLRPDLTFAGSPISLQIDGRESGRWDPLRLEQIVTNLLSNAIKFGLGKRISVKVSHRDDVTELEVSDQGMGIPADVQARIFEPFERGVSVRHYGGLGLGLYIVKTLVEGMGGSVRVESTSGVGSTFTVELPRGQKI